MHPTSSKQNFILSTFSALFLSLTAVLLLWVPLIRGHPHPMDFCSLTREEMIQGMGGAHLNLGYVLKVVKGTTTVMLQVPANGGSLKGLYLYATDTSGRTVGMWKTEAEGFQPVVSNTCNGAGITHAHAQIKVSQRDKPFTFKLNLPNEVSSATVRGFVVEAKTTWQELDPITVTKKYKKANGTSGASSLASLQSSAYVLEMFLWGLTCFALI